MLGKSEKEKKEDIKALVYKIADTGKTDTVYRDIYLSRVREILSGLLSLEQYHELIKERTWMAHLPNKINVAMEKEDWKLVKELGERLTELKKWEEVNHPLFDLGAMVYDAEKLILDPFSPGLNHLAGIPSKALSGLRDRSLKQLKELQKEDPANREFYSKRQAVFDSLLVNDAEDVDSGIALLDETGLKERAQEALKGGNIELMEQVADLILKKKSSKGRGAENGPASTEMKIPSSERVFSFSSETLENARSLGLTAVSLDRSEEYEALYRYAFHPVFTDEPEQAWNSARKPLDKAFPSDIPDALKKHIELYAIHTFLTSGGSRYLPDFVAEDCLVEDFPEFPKNGDEPDSELLPELGLKSRTGLSRKQIEHALFENGNRIIKDRLGLDQELFRLVCIPPDIYLRFGKNHDWGLQEVWTHFDGYQLSQKGSLSALAGGDVRYGGIYDLVSIGTEYFSDRVIARFAVVQRKRMVTW